MLNVFTVFFETKVTPQDADVSIIGLTFVLFFLYFLKDLFKTSRVNQLYVGLNLLIISRTYPHGTFPLLDSAACAKFKQISLRVDFLAFYNIFLAAVATFFEFEVFRAIAMAL